MSEMHAEGVTAEFSRHIAMSRFEDLPQTVLHEAKRSFINWIACALGGCKSEPVKKTLAVVRQLSGAPEAAVIGSSEGMDVAQACLINSMSAYVLDFDDAHYGERIVLHPGGAVGPAALAMAERVGGSGKDLLHAFLLGIDVMCRIGNAVFESEGVGWYPTSNVAGIGAACAAGKLLQLDQERIATTIGSAATLSAGMRASHGTMLKSFSPARGASTGVTMALLAQAHVTGPRAALEAAGVGFADLMGSSSRIASATELLGEHYEISNNAYKPYPCAVGLHPVITACIQLQKSGIVIETISSIEIRVTARVERANAIKYPRSREQAKISLPHSAAVSLLYGNVSESHYDKVVLEDARVIKLRERVRLVVDDTLHKSQGRVIIHDQLGMQVDSGVVYGIGTIFRPMSDSDLMGKLADLASSTLAADEINSLAEVCWDMENLANLDHFTSLICKDVT